MCCCFIIILSRDGFFGLFFFATFQFCTSIMLGSLLLPDMGPDHDHGEDDKDVFC